MMERTATETLRNDPLVLSSVPSHLSKISRNQLINHHRIHQSKSKTKSTIVIHAKNHPPSISPCKKRSTNHSHRKSKRRKNRRMKVVPYNVINYEFNDFHETKTTDEWSSRSQSRGELNQIIEETKERKRRKQCRCLFYPYSLWCLLGLLFTILILGILLAVLLVKFLPKSSTTTTMTTATTVTTTSTATSTTTSRPFGALSIYAIVTASYFNPGAGTATAQGDGLVDRQPNGAAFVAAYAPQYVQLELPDEYNITNVCLLVTQTPSGATHHQLLVGPSMNSTQIVSDLNGVTYTNQWINITYNPPLNNVRFLHLKTISSPSWVAWTKFLVYGV